MPKLLTIGMAVYDDPQGVWFTIESIRNMFPEHATEVEFLVVDNNPTSPEGQATKAYIDGHFGKTDDQWKAHYVSATPRKSTSVRNLVFHCAETEYVLCVDSHILLKPGSLTKTLAFLKSEAAQNDLYHGPAFHEMGYIYATHMNPAFRGQNWGTWGVMVDEDGHNVFNERWPEPIEIPAHGMGLFLTRRDTWLGFPVSFRNFGGEECYIHEKYRLHGRKCWCLPFLGWVHYYGHFVRGAMSSNRVKYPLTTAAKFRNILVGFREIGLDESIPTEYYRAFMDPGEVDRVVREVESLDIKPIPRPEGYQPFLGFPIRVNDGPMQESGDYRPFERRLKRPG
ncbi:MAG: hypothetical protein KatS3mg109_0004 [Pirellulaceae bacterium]|nr:MAG: hypothetical protein KatS3mg109_0004 [Pirellulaceae bacterium]